MRSPDEIYETGLNDPDVNQQDAAINIFAFVQELRRQASASDPDSPDELTFQEIITASIKHVPGVATSFLAMLRDDSKMASDGEMLGHILSRQLGLYG
ncbi:MAG: hypothetical protein V3U85_10270 [Hyphomicrobium sp.]